MKIDYQTCQMPIVIGIDKSNVIVTTKFLLLPSIYAEKEKFYGKYHYKKQNLENSQENVM